jgi:membrane-associated phospholipid phosphatase
MDETADRLVVTLWPVACQHIADRSDRHQERRNVPLDGKWLSFRTWTVFLVATIMATAICIYWLDVPIAFHFHGHAGRYSPLGRGFSSSILVAVELAFIASLSIARMVQGSLPTYARTLLMACCSSLIAFEANDRILKVIFGRQSPTAFFNQPALHLFHFLQGDEHSSFPSGHMVMATAFAVVIIRLHPRTAPPLIALLCLGAFALLIGDWHFASDVVAGTFEGWTAGLMAAELWAQHIRRHALQ